MTNYRKLKGANTLIKRAWLLFIASSFLLISACTPTGEATEEIIESEPVKTIVETESKEEESSNQREETKSKESQTTDDQQS